MTEDQQFEHPSGSIEPPVPESFPQPVLADASIAPPVGFQSPVAPRDPVWNGWDVLLITVLAGVTLVANQAGAAWLGQSILYPHTPFLEVLERHPWLMLATQALSDLAVVFYLILLIEGKYRMPFWKAIKWNWPSRSRLKWLGIGVLTVVIDLVGHYLPMPKSSPFDQLFATPTDAYLIAAFSVTLAPVMEELFFRGFLYPVLARWTGVAPAIILTALPFGLLHYLQYRSWSAVLLIMLVGVVLGIVREVTNSVGASFLVHVGYNGTLMVLAAMATDGFRHMEKAVLVAP